jgi:L-iditol 2-dehydrogenase
MALMRSVQLVAPRRLELRAMEGPRDPGPGEVTVRVRTVGICGSDLHYYLEGGCTGYPAVYPSVLGHEPAGEVIAVGDLGANLRQGDRVVIEPAITCGACEFCRAGRHNLCDTVRFMGGRQLPGLLRECATIPATNAVRLPESLSFREAAVVEPLSVVLHSLELGGLKPGEDVAVFGAGPIGLLAAAAARARGAARIISADRLPHRLALAREMGADMTVDIRQESAVEAVLDVTGGRGAHLVVDAAGRPDSLNPAFRAARRGGRVVLIGIPSESPMPADLHAALDREVALYSVKRSNHNDDEAIALIASGQVAASRLVTHAFALECADRAFETVAGYADGVGKAVIEL